MRETRTSKTLVSLSESRFGPGLRKALAVGAIGGLAVLGFNAIRSLEFTDTPGPSKHDFGRTVNGISTLVCGIAAQEIFGNASVNATIQKPWFPDAKVDGRTTADFIDTEVELSMTSSHFTAQKEGGLMKGKVDKSEFDWSVEQTGPNTWHIGRWGYKFDSTLVIDISNGQINGSLERTMGWDWTFSGTYDTAGNIKINVGTPFLRPNFVIEGTLSPDGSISPATR